MKNLKPNQKPKWSGTLVGLCPKEGSLLEYMAKEVTVVDGEIVSVKDIGNPDMMRVVHAYAEGRLWSTVEQPEIPNYDLTKA